MANELRRWIALVEAQSNSELDAPTLTHVRSWVGGNPSDETRETMQALARRSTTKAAFLIRCHHADPEYQKGHIIDLPAISFTSNGLDEKNGGAAEWHSKHRAIIEIENPRRGFDIPYNLESRYGFAASDERETVVSGRYRVTRKEMVQEPHTSSDHYQVPKYTLSEI